MLSQSYQRTVSLLSTRLLLTYRRSGRYIFRLLGLVASGKSTLCKALKRGIGSWCQVVDERDYAPIFNKYRRSSSVQRWIGVDLVRRCLVALKLGKPTLLTSDFTVNVQVFHYLQARKTGAGGSYRKYRRGERSLNQYIRSSVAMTIVITVEPRLAGRRFLKRERVNLLRFNKALIPWSFEDFTTFKLGLYRSSLSVGKRVVTFG